MKMRTEFVGIPMMSGRNLVEFALVDTEDVELVKGHRWNRSGGYAVNGRLGPMHRHILGLEQGVGFVHHVNEDKADNRRSNLQVFATASEANRQPHPGRERVGREARARWVAERAA